MKKQLTLSAQFITECLLKLANDDQYRLAFATNPTQILNDHGILAQNLPSAINLPSKSAIQQLLDRYYAQSGEVSGAEDELGSGGSSSFLFNLFIFRVSLSQGTQAKAS